jgi:hypothetical protein
MKKTKKVMIDLNLLERIAEYYEFPFAVFFSDIKSFKNKTRTESKLKRIKDFENKLAQLFNEYFGD